MTYLEKVQMWNGIFAVGKGVTYLLAMACMIKYLIGG